MTRMSIAIVLTGCVWVGGCGTPAFSTGASSAAEPESAAKQAARKAIEALGDAPLRALVYTAYFPTDAADANPHAYQPDPTAEKAVVKTLADIAKQHKAVAIGCRARGWTADHRPPGGVTVLAIGGGARVQTAAVPIQDDRTKTGRSLAKKLAGVGELKAILLFSEMRLCFEPGVSSPNAFVRAMLHTAPRGTVILGGNAMNDPLDEGEEGLSGAVFLDDRILTGHVVALAVGGAFEVITSGASEFEPVGPTVTVTEAHGPWVVSLDGRPAADVYRQIAGMRRNEPFTADWRHPVGVVISPEKTHLKMIVNWIYPGGLDRRGKSLPLPPGSLRFGEPIAEGTAVRVLRGGRSDQAIDASARSTVEKTLADAKKKQKRPLALLAIECCTRGRRRADATDEPRPPILPDEKTKTPVFGFYAFGLLGPLGGTYQKMDHRFQQHCLLTALLVGP